MRGEHDGATDAAATPAGPAPDPGDGPAPVPGTAPDAARPARRGAADIGGRAVADGSRLDRRTLGRETALVLALSLGADAVSALISFTGALTAPGSLRGKTATLVGTQAPGRPWLDLAWQLFSIATALVPVLLAAHLLTREGAGTRAIGFDLRRPRGDLARGAVIAAAVGGTGLLLYLSARSAGVNLTVVPESLPAVWWRIPVLILAAAQNAVLEEVIVVGYLLRRLDQAGWGAGAALAASALLRGTYHLYQGLGGFVGNAVMGALFVLLYRRWGRVGPLVAAHTLIDGVAFVGYALLAGRVGWLPT